MCFAAHQHLSMAQPTSVFPRKPGVSMQRFATSTRFTRKHLVKAVKHSPHTVSELQESKWLHRTLAGSLASAACLGLLLQAPVQAEELSIAFPASSNQEIRQAQQTMVESWAYVQTLYLDQNEISHSNWTQAIQDALAETFKASSASDVTQITNKLLASLGDPYTRLLQGDDAAALTAEEQGKIVATGLGLQPVVLTGLVNDPNSDPTAAPPPDAPAQYRDSSPSMVAMAAGDNSAEIYANAALISDAAAGQSGAHNAAAAADGDAAGVEGPQVLLVSFVVEGSPAEAAGVKQGDVLLEVQGQPIAGKELRQVYKLLSKESDVTLLRQPELTSAAVHVSAQTSSTSSPVLPMTQIAPADAAGGTSSSTSSSKRSSIADLLPGYSPERVYTVHLKPEVLEFAPVQYGIIDLNTANNSSSSSDSGVTTTTTTSSSSSGPQVGYLKLLTFSATAPQQVAEALIDMQQLQPKQPQSNEQLRPAEAQKDQQRQQLAGIIIDLRDNPGGIVEAGVDIAVDFLRPGQVLCVVVDKSGEEQRVVLPAAHTLTNLPLIILVNKSTASTSELLAGALHDELAAPLIGTTTYGKGRTQRVIQLSDGSSTLLVSTMKYFTPKHTEIDKVGLKPDVVCDPPEVVGQRWTGGKQEEIISLLDDPCIKLAAEKLTGVSAAVAN